ncbi:MAG: hypothetical protein MUO21_05875 [Nitrososphaeraceae archaeon]|nr:hypothetical protein [Nitrososphaeraceae archaeon]
MYYVQTPKVQYLLYFFGFTIFLYLNNYYTVYSHIPNNNIVKQEIVDQYDKIKVQFAYDQEKIKINTLTDLKFSVLNSTTEDHIKNFLARIVVTEGSEVFRFDNIKVNDGDFSVKHSFTNYGTHQVILRVDTNSSITSASFDVIIPSSQSSSSPFPMGSVKSNLDNDKNTQNFTTFLIIGVGLAISIGMTIILLSILKKN